MTFFDFPRYSGYIWQARCEIQNFFIWLKVCCVLSNIGGSDESQLWVVIGSGVMLEMEVGISKRARQRAWRYPAYLWYLRRKQTVIHFPTSREKMSLHELVNCKTFSFDWRFVVFFETWEALKRASCCGLSSVAVKRTGCAVWQLECQASNVTASVQSDHLLR